MWSSFVIMQNMELEKYLLKLGFSQKETKLYEAIIESAPISITELAKLSGSQKNLFVSLAGKAKEFRLCRNHDKGQKESYLFPPSRSV